MKFKCCGGDADRDYQMMMSRFILEPRAEIRAGKFLVAWDCETHKYLRVPGNKKKYMHFVDSTVAYAWIMAQQRMGVIK